VAGSRRRQFVVRAIKLAIGLVVLVAVGRYAWATWAALRAEGTAPRLDLAGFAWAVVLYLVGLVLDGIWFARVMDASPTPVPRWASVRAYLISHLAKYVPGKAMVVVVRAGLVVPYGARPASAAIATFYETLAMMAAGGLLAGAGFALVPSAGTVPIALGPLGAHGVPLAALGLVLGLALLVLALPRVFAALASLLTLPIPGVGPEAVPRLSMPLLGEGLAWSSAGWVFLGLSQVAVLGAMGVDIVRPETWVAVMSSVALATVAGFVVPVAPGGLGVREFVLWTSLGASVDHRRAVLASLALRLAWLVGEVLAAALLVVGRRASDRVAS
jgi:hypothetical protein